MMYEKPFQPLEASPEQTVGYRALMAAYLTLLYTVEWKGICEPRSLSFVGGYGPSR